MVNRTQTIVLGFFLLVWASLVAILAVTPEVYDQALSLPPGNRRPAELAFLASLSAFIALPAIGVLRRWRWMFWLIMVAFLFGVLRVPASLLELAGVLPAAGPTWYVLHRVGLSWSRAACIAVRRRSLGVRRDQAAAPSWAPTRTQACAMTGSARVGY